MAISNDHLYKNQLQSLESQATEMINDILADLRKTLFKKLTRKTVNDIYIKLKSDDLNATLKTQLYNALLPAVEAGFAEGRKSVEVVLGTKSLLDPGFDWGVINESARQWLAQHTFSLTYANEFSITESTAKQLKTAIDIFISTPDMTINELSRSVANIFDNIRGNTIAVTEVTRAFANGNLTVWRGSGVVEGKKWNTGEDELVCPICVRNNNRVVDLDSTFDLTVDTPPAHPRCRCWLTPVIKK